MPIIYHHIINIWWKANKSKRIKQACHPEVRLWSWRASNERTNFLFPLRTHWILLSCRTHTHGQSWVGLPAKWHAPLLYPHKHTGTHTPCPVSCQSLPQLQGLLSGRCHSSGVRGHHTVHTHSCFHLFVCLLVQLHFLESASLRPSFTLDFFPPSVTRLLEDLFFWLVTSELTAGTTQVLAHLWKERFLPKCTLRKLCKLKFVLHFAVTKQINWID